MTARFTLENRTNKYGECPIRLSWSFGGQRFQTTLGISVKKTDWDEKNKLVKSNTQNHNGQSADDINFFIKRIGLVVAGIEEHYVRNEKALNKDMIKPAIREALSLDFARPEDIIERHIEGWKSVTEKETEYYRGPDMRYYKLICDANGWYNTEKFNILQQLFGKRERIIVPEYYFRLFKHSDRSYKTIEFEKVDYKEVFGV